MNKNYDAYRQSVATDADIIAANEELRSILDKGLENLTKGEAMRRAQLSNHIRQRQRELARKATIIVASIDELARTLEVDATNIDAKPLAANTLGHGELHLYNNKTTGANVAYDCPYCEGIVIGHVTTLHYKDTNPQAERKGTPILCGFCDLAIARDVQEY